MSEHLSLKSTTGCFKSHGGVATEVDCAIAIFLKPGGSETSFRGIGIGITVEVAQLSGNLPDNQVLFKGSRRVYCFTGEVFKNLIVIIIQTNGHDMRFGDGVH